MKVPYAPDEKGTDIALLGSEVNKVMKKMSEKFGRPLIAWFEPGNICETDTFAWDRPIPNISEGDFLVFYNAGAYGYEMSSNYNARYKPAQVLYEKEEAKLISRADDFTDLLRLQIPLNS